MCDDLLRKRIADVRRGHGLDEQSTEDHLLALVGDHLRDLGADFLKRQLLALLALPVELEDVPAAILRLDWLRHLPDGEPEKVEGDVRGKRLLEPLFREEPDRAALEARRVFGPRSSNGREVGIRSERQRNLLRLAGSSLVADGIIRRSVVRGIDDDVRKLDATRRNELRLVLVEVLAHLGVRRSRNQGRDLLLELLDGELALEVRLQLVLGLTVVLESLLEVVLGHSGLLDLSLECLFDFVIRRNEPVLLGTLEHCLFLNERLEDLQASCRERDRSQLGSGRAAFLQLTVDDLIDLRHGNGHAVDGRSGVVGALARSGLAARGEAHDRKENGR